MLTASELAGMRATSASALPDTCRVTRQAGEGTLNETTGEVDYPTPTVIFEGPCRIRPQGAREQDAESGDLHGTFAPYVATLPHTAAPAVDDYLTVLTSSDGGMVGRSFQVRHIGWSAWEIDRRVTLEDAEQPRDAA